VFACEIVDRLDERVFETAQAVMHTAGQSSLMSYAGSGTNALDRGVEAFGLCANGDEPCGARLRDGNGSSGSTLIPLQKTLSFGARVGLLWCSPVPRSRPGRTRIPRCLRIVATGNPVISEAASERGATRSPSPCVSFVKVLAARRV
jgi:hypothetical protein